MTSLIGISFTAYLTEKQVEQFTKDKRVLRLTQDVYLQPSALWNSTTDGYNQVRSWGLYAMGIASAGPSNGTATVYVLDTGVDVNSDLNVISRIAAINGINPIGCFQHSTHVAGIIGAADNGYGVVGALPGVPLVSIAIGDQNSGNCSIGFSASALIAGLQRVYEMVFFSGNVGIANLSFNIEVVNIFSASETVGEKMLAVAHPSLSEGYKGTLIVQSAGNHYQDACSHAYNFNNAPSVYDGVLVVGGLDANGQAVKPFDYLASQPALPGFVSLPLATDEPGSNYGGCVEVWAPSQRIKSTWGGGFQFLSGTSMAAPHIAGFAARLLEGDTSIGSSVALETAVRSYIKYITGSNLPFPSFPDPVTANPTIELVEGVPAAPVSIRSGTSPTNTISFTNFADQVSLRYQAVGARAAQSCIGYGTLNGSVYLWEYLPATYTFPTLAAGQHHWEITCYSPQGTQTIAVANATIIPRVTVAWVAKTITTPNMDWQVLNNGESVTWSTAPSAPFDQFYNSTGADNCSILSSGFTGNILNDFQNPNFNPNVPPPLFAQTVLWNSNVYGPYPNSYVFPTFYFGSAPLAGSYEGYKWLLTCWNAYESKTAVMYGKPVN